MLGWITVQYIWEHQKCIIVIPLLETGDYCGETKGPLLISLLEGKKTTTFPLPQQRQSSPVSLLTVVWFGFLRPLAYISAGGLYTEAEKAEAIWPLRAGTFFPLTTANKPQKRGWGGGIGKTKFSRQCNAVKLKLKILGNLRKSQLALLFLRFDGLHHNTVLLAFSSGLEHIWLVAALYSKASGFLPNPFYLQLSSYRLRTLMHITPLSLSQPWSSSFSPAEILRAEG